MNASPDSSPKTSRGDVADRAEGIVVAPQSEAAHEGAAVLAAGGNAADAAVTAALVQAVADPHRCGLGGFGCATVYWSASREALAIGYHGRVGSRAREDQWQSRLEQAAPDGFGFILSGKENDVGYRSITTPGTIAGLGALHARYGSRPWEELLERAAAAAERGFLVGPGLAEFWRRPGLHGRVSTRDRLALTEYGGRTWFDDDGEPFRAGKRKRLPDVAKTYRWLGKEGAATFYRGRMAECIAADLEAHDALVTRDDLRRYEADLEPPLEGRYRGHRILTSPLPGGGTSLLQALEILQGDSPARFEHNSAEYVTFLGRILRAVWQDRLDHHGDPRFTTASSEALLSRKHLDAMLRADTTQGRVENPASPDTTQLSIVDRDGNCVSLSHSLGYGSGVFTPQLGFMYNNCMSAFDPRPGRAASIAPFKARSTAIAETIVLRGDQPFLVLGSPGAARITAALVQVLVNVIDFGMTVAEAVVQPRFDAFARRSLLLESRFPPAVVDALESAGWDVQQSPKPFGMVGRVYAVQVGEGGQVTGGVDPGEPGAAVRA